jgi:hypothetical protein
MQKEAKKDRDRMPMNVTDVEIKSILEIRMNPRIAADITILTFC